MDKRLFKPALILLLVIVAGGAVTAFLLPARKANVYTSAPIVEPKPLEKTSQDSEDGTAIVTMKKEVNNDGSLKYSFYVSNNLVFSNTLAKGQTMSIPFNTWSNDNKYFFVKDSDGNYYVVSAANGANYINPALIFHQKYPDSKLTDITGWASPTLLVLNFDTSDGAKASMWFDIASQTFIPLATRFN